MAPKSIVESEGASIGGARPQQGGIPEPILRGVRRDFPVEYLFDAAEIEDMRRGGVRHERGLLCYVLPPFQRPPVWTEGQQRAFVEGIFLGFGCGYHVAAAPNWDTDGNPLESSRWLIDGQQRITALAAFHCGRLSIFDGIRWPDLTKREQLRFLREPFPVIEVEATEDHDYLLGLYNRLNYGGTPHVDPARLHSALQEAASVIGSINVGKHHAVTADGEIHYRQREEWCRWAIDEVLPMVRAAMAGAPIGPPVGGANQ